MKNKKIKFTARDPYSWEVCPRPIPASQSIPQWWKNLTPYIPDIENPQGNKLIVRNRMANYGAKKCTPMLDALLSGYVIPLWTDVYVRQVNGRPEINWKTSEDVFSIHQPDSRQLDIPTGYGPDVFKFHNKWLVKTPKNYSVLCTQPSGYRSTPFNAVPAIIDSDKSTLEMLFPVWLKEDFEGVIERGTPMVQITPFRREDWSSEFDHLNEGEYELLEDKNFNSTIVGHYLKNVWTKKIYR